MTIETEQDVIALKRIGKIVSYVLEEMLAAVVVIKGAWLDIFSS